MSDKNTFDNSAQYNPGYAHDVSSPIMDGTNRVRIGAANIQVQPKQFESGAKSSGNLPPYECLTLTFLRRAAMRMKLGMHYGKHNWKKGARDKAFILERLNHAVEHLYKAMAEIDTEVPTQDDDLAAVVVNCMFAMEYQELGPINTPPQTSSIHAQNSSQYKVPSLNQNID